MGRMNQRFTEQLHPPATEPVQPQNGNPATGHTAEVDGALVTELQQLAAETARAAARRIVAHRAELMGSTGLAASAETKSSAVDPVTVVDKAAESFITEALLSARPDDGLLGEEGASRPSRTAVTWVVDPIDGTVNFLYGIEEYAVSIAAQVEGRTVAGAVINVAHETLYEAGLGHGAWRTDAAGKRVQLACGAETNPALALIATGFGYSATRRAGQARLLTEILPQVRDIRRMGAAALDLCRVAEGTVDAYYEHGLHLWDYAAGMLIAQEAGARVVAPEPAVSGAEGKLFYAAGYELMEAFEQVLIKAQADRPLV